MDIRSMAADMEMGRLLEENRVLSQELKLAQNDKNFVWSLWKKLQVTNPDISQAVGLVVQREKEKAELRDRKVLEVLQMKDEKIEELHSALADKTQELGQSTIKRADVQDDMSRLQREVDSLQDRNAALDLQMHSVEHREKSSDNVHRQKTSEYELEKKEVFKKIEFLSSELEKTRSEKADELALRVQMENKVRVMDRDIQQKMGKFEQLVKELEESRSLLRRFENNAKQQAQDLEYKNQELEVVRRELAELWTTHNQLTDHSGQQADLIRQIHVLQSDTQKMMKNQEDAHSMETTSIQQMYTELTARYDQGKKMEADLRQQVLVLKKGMLDKDDIIAELQGKVEKVPATLGRDHSGSFLDQDQVEPVLDLEFKVNSMQKEIDNLRRKLLERERRIDDLEDEAVNQTIEFDVARLNRHERTHSTPSREFRSIGLSPMKNVPEPVVKGHRSRSMSPTRRDQPRQRYHIQKDLDDTKTILKLKMKELGELKKAHGKRLERLKSVQENYKNVKDQLKTLEGEYYGSKKKQKKVKRADPKDLRHEDSSAVWNELAYFKNENRTLVADRMALEEEVDSLRVQSSQDAATVHELKLSLEQEREERVYEKKKTERETEDSATRKSEITLLKSEVQNKAVVVERLERDLRDIRGDRDVLMEDKRQLKQDIMDLKQESAQHRMDQADLKRDIHRLKRELQEEKAISKLNASKAVAPTVKTVIVKPAAKRRKKPTWPRGSNGSPNKKMAEVREDEDWEELSDASEHEEEDSMETGTDTLGQNIVQRSRFPRGDNSTTDASSDPSGFKMQRTVPMKPTSRARRSAPRPTSPHRHCPCSCNCAAVRASRDTGTSPIHKEASPTPVPRRSPTANSAALRQLKPMKQRVGYLQQQVITLRESRSAALKTLSELKDVNTQLQGDLNLANQRLRMSKQSIQKLTADVEKRSIEKGELETRLLMKPDLAQLDPVHTDHDWKVLETRLKSSTNELSRQSAMVRQLKQDNEAAHEQIRQFHDKVSRVERDNSQKRTLLDDQRGRVKQALENAKADADSLEALETRTKLIQDTNEKQKIQLESYKKRLGAVTREKREYEERFLKLAAEVDKKNKLLLDSHARKMELETALGQMEQMATQQMKCLARESEDALETARDKLREIQQVLQSYQRFVKSLSNELLRRVVHTRVALKDESSKKSQTNKSNASMQRAQDLAKDILNLSQSDLDEIMSADGDAATKQDAEMDVERRRDKKWAKKIDKLQNTNDDFSLSLVDLFVQKMEERNELTAKLYNTRPIVQSDSRVQVS